MSKLDIIVIGLGHQSLEDHLPAIQESNYWNLVGVSDIDKSTSQKTAEEYNVPYATDVSELLELLPKSPDVALIAVPHKDYLPLIEILVAKKINIIKEKPFATSLEEASAMVKLAHENDISIQVTLQRRFNPIFLSFNQLIKRIGKIYSIEARYTLNIARLDEGWRSSKVFAGGGALVDLGYHYIDLIVWYFGLPDSITCRLSTSNREGQQYDVEDTAIANFTYNENGGDDQVILGNLVVSRVYPEKDESLIAYGSKGSVYIRRGKVCRRDLDGNEVEVLERIGSWPSAILDQLDEFAKNIIEGKNRGSIDPQHLEHVAFIEASYESAENHSTIDPHVCLNKLKEIE